MKNQTEKRFQKAKVQRLWSWGSNWPSHLIELLVRSSPSSRFYGGDVAPGPGLRQKRRPIASNAPATSDKCSLAWVMYQSDNNDRPVSNDRYAVSYTPPQTYWVSNSSAVSPAQTADAVSVSRALKMEPCTHTSRSTQVYRCPGDTTTVSCWRKNLSEVAGLFHERVHEWQCPVIAAPRIPAMWTTKRSPTSCIPDHPMRWCLSRNNSGPWTMAVSEWIRNYRTDTGIRHYPGGSFMAKGTTFGFADGNHAQFINWLTKGFNQ